MVWLPMKTKPIQSQFVPGRRNLLKQSPKPAALRLPPGFYGFVPMSMVEKTKPICRRAKLAQSLF